MSSKPLNCCSKTTKNFSSSPIKDLMARKLQKTTKESKITSKKDKEIVNFSENF